MSKKKVIFIIVGVTAFVAGIVAGVAKRKKKSKTKEYDFPEMDLDDYFDDLDDLDDDYDEGDYYEDFCDCDDEIHDPELRDASLLISATKALNQVIENMIERKEEEFDE